MEISITTSIAIADALVARKIITKCRRVDVLMIIGEILDAQRAETIRTKRIHFDN